MASGAPVPGGSCCRAGRVQVRSTVFPCFVFFWFSGAHLQVDMWVCSYFLGYPCGFNGNLKGQLPLWCPKKGTESSSLAIWRSDLSRIGHLRRDFMEFDLNKDSGGNSEAN